MKILQTIRTPSQLFEAGGDLPADVELDGPLTRADWQRLGHLEAEAPVKAEPTPAAPRARPVPASDPAED